MDTAPTLLRSFAVVLVVSLSTLACGSGAEEAPAVGDAPMASVDETGQLPPSIRGDGRTPAGKRPQLRSR